VTPVVTNEQRKQWNELARVCACGCGRHLLRADGSPDWSRRRFASKDCLASDKRARLHTKREAQSSKQVASISVDGADPLTVKTLNEMASLLRHLGHEVTIVRPKRTKKARTA
jgi:hypothetical protein